MKNLNDILWDKESVEDILSKEENQDILTQEYMKKACMAPSCSQDGCPPDGKGYTYAYQRGC
ncbi:MAG: hypothetical protein Q4D65_08410 [Peptostreptococcaceae bacterium]|nr:hypothetical protein [Peptostreptococcaceae bacterium]